MFKTNIKTKTKTLLASAVLVALSTPAHANLIVNGDFSSFDTTQATSPQGTLNGQPFYNYANSFTGISNWYIVNGGVRLIPDTIWQAPPGTSYSIDLNGHNNFARGAGSPYAGGGLAQIVSNLTVGQTYQLDFYHSLNPLPDNPATQNFPKLLDIYITAQSTGAHPSITASGNAVTLPDGDIEYSLSNTDNSRTVTSMLWVEDQITFTANSTNMNIGFVSLRPSGLSPTALPPISGPTIGNISLTAVPEPATLVPLTLATLLLTRRRPNPTKSQK